MSHLILGIWKFLVKILGYLLNIIFDAYMLEYEVNSNEYDQKQNFGQMEHRNKDEVKGEWYVQLPDGRVQHVRYYIDKYSGFVFKENRNEIHKFHK